jgi:hypothetical protein
MRKRILVVMLMLGLLSGTMSVGCGQTMTYRVAMDAYSFVTSLLFQLTLNALTPPQTTNTTTTTTTTGG